MSNKNWQYCIDANVLIQAWNSYYSPRLCPDYWKLLSKLGEDDRIIIPEKVHEEIIRTEDDLTEWLKKSKISVEKINTPITECLRKIYTVNPIHQLLVDNINGRSLADPWLIAHAMNSEYCVVTREKHAPNNTTRIRIPNVCDNMGIRCINDFQMIEELGIKFSCAI